MVSLTLISISTDDKTSDDGRSWVEEACDGGGAEEQEALQLSGLRKRVLEGPLQAMAEFSDI